MMKKYRIVRKYTDDSEWYVIQVPRIFFGGWKTLKVKSTVAGPDCIGSCPDDYTPYWREKRFSNPEDAKEWMEYEAPEIKEEIINHD